MITCVCQLFNQVLRCSLIIDHIPTFLLIIMKSISKRENKDKIVERLTLCTVNISNIKTNVNPICLNSKVLLLYAVW